MTAPESVQQAVERLNYDAHATRSSDGMVVVREADLDAVVLALAAAEARLAEMQRVLGEKP